MVDSLLTQLKSPDPAQRRAAIVALANARDPRALPALAHVHQSDPEPTLRELALKAGRYIHQHAPIGAAAAPAADAETDDVAPASVPHHEAERARGYLDAAAGHHVEGHTARAIENLARAFELNPALRGDSFATNLATTLTGLPHFQAIAAMSDPAQRAELIAELGGKRKLRATSPSLPDTDTATWGNVAIDALLYAIVSALSMAAIFLLTLSTIRELYDALPPSADAGSLTAEDLDLLTDASLLVMLPFALLSGLYATVTLFAQAGAIHFSAITFFGGRASFVYFLRRFIPFQTWLTLIYAALFVVLALVGGEYSFWVVLGIVSLVGSVTVSYLLSSLIGRVYQFGAGAGCGAIVIGGIVLAAVLFVGSVVLSTLLSVLIDAFA